MSQELQILNHLKKGPITPMQALNKYGCMRLAARVHGLRGSGHKIVTETITRGKAKFAKYRLVA